MNTLSLRTIATQELSDLTSPSLRRFQIEFALSAITYWAAFFVGVTGQTPTTRLTAIAIAVLACFRCIMFLHPIFHLPRPLRLKMQNTYDWLFGIWGLIPYALYAETHRVHHHPAHTASNRDPEYLAFSKTSRAFIASYIAKSLLIPSLLLIRFTTLTWLGTFSLPLRKWVELKASALSLRPDFEARIPTEAERKKRLRKEWIGSLFFVSLVVASPGGLAIWFFVATACSLMNALQLLVLHEYRGREEKASSTYDELDDTTTFTTQTPWFTEIWAPVGQRFHALHHLVPNLPYYAMPEAHARLIEILPENSAYHRTFRKSYVAQFRRIWERSKNVEYEIRNQKLARSAPRHRTLLSRPLGQLSRRRRELQDRLDQGRPRQ